MFAPTVKVRDLSSLRNQVIPMFEGKLVIKGDAFEKFKRVIDLVSQRKHFAREGIRKILDIAYSMNTRRRRVPKITIVSSY